MKNRLIITLSLMLIALIPGCTTFKGSAGKVLASTAVTVDHAMQGWAQWVKAGQSNAEQEAKVKAAYQKYQAAMDIAKNAYVVAATSGDESGWEIAANILDQNKAALLELISAFQSGKVAR